MKNLARLLSLSLLALTPLSLADVVREGSGARREALNAMELKPFPAELWSKLADWTGGKPIASADTSGQVVIICTWSGWYQPSVRALSTAKRLASDYAKDGLVVVAVHNPEGWKDAEKPTANEGAKLFVAHDATGDFRKALMVDQDPDFYIIDRAGQLRYADITTESVEEAAKALLAETAEKAAGITKDMASAKAKQEEDFRHTGAVRQEVDIRALPDVPFIDPTADTYNAAAWPKKEKSQSGYEPTGPASITFPEDGWFPSKPKIKGRVIVVYAFSPYIRRTYEDIMPAMDLLQRQHGRDITVVGSVVPVKPDNQGREESVDQASVTKMAQQFLAARNLDHSILADGGASVGSSRDSRESLPSVVIASSDGVVRWVGDPRLPTFKSAFDQVLRVDPGLKARRAAEDQFIKTKK